MSVDVDVEAVAIVHEVLPCKQSRRFRCHSDVIETRRTLQPESASSPCVLVVDLFLLDLGGPGGSNDRWLISVARYFLYRVLEKKKLRYNRTRVWKANSSFWVFKYRNIPLANTNIQADCFRTWLK